MKIIPCAFQKITVKKTVYRFNCSFLGFEEVDPCFMGHPWLWNSATVRLCYCQTSLNTELKHKTQHSSCTQLCHVQIFKKCTLYHPFWNVYYTCRLALFWSAIIQYDFPLFKLPAFSRFRKTSLLKNTLVLKHKIYSASIINMASLREQILRRCPIYYWRVIQEKLMNYLLVVYMIRISTRTVLTRTRISKIWYIILLFAINM